MLVAEGIVEKSKAPAIARAVAALRLLGRSDRPLALGEIAPALGIAPSSCLYVLRALVTEELVAFDPMLKRYALDVGVLGLARHWLLQNPFPAMIQPALDELSRRFGLMTLGVQIVGLEHVVVLAVSDGSDVIRLTASVGSRFPALISATGRCIAAFGDHPAAEVARRFRALRWAEPPSYEAWQSEVDATRARGIGIDRGNYMAGVTVVAAPIWRRPGNPSHAIVALGVSEAIGTREPALAEALIDAAARLTERDLMPASFRGAIAAGGPGAARMSG